ncbi:SUN domain-containing ossification factor [Belonocnema kinseyi]|uniref:SUN domain-containing ossification factor n=1 Tax=Belonocnema kinseyi TaxID=2817044 RepID=UPI00143CEABD|nr:SUN domain-containing ossification factor [Belonocnema kinseyi]
MKFCVTYVYWTLLLISVVSSGLLFLIVASEGVQIPESSSEKDGTFESTNKFSINESKEEIQETNNPLVSDVEVSASIKTDNYIEEKSEPIADNLQITSETDRLTKPEKLEVFAESLTQQPNLSQGISETGQAVVLTLVDTAASELQSLADPKIVSEFRARSLSNNLTLTNPTVRGPEKTLEPIDPEINLETPTEQVNDSATAEKEVAEGADDDSEFVVVVRAEKKSGGEETRIEEDLKLDEELLSKEDLPKEDDLNPAPELNDSAARAQLVGGSTDDAAVILDGIAGSGSSDTHEDMPSFSEWAQKRLEEAEKKKTHPNVSVQNPGNPGKNVGGMKMRSKNYASPDCGAKIVATNPESRSARNVLVSTRDEYMLNTCTSRIWFVVELCEAIQAKKIELANFELFSSSPKDFSVYVSDRFPTRDWSSVGHFTAKDERDIQNFALQPHLFGKFIKIELHSHYGSEHFCPISLFRAYGTSEFEVLETETDVQIPISEDEDNEHENGEDPLDFEGGEPARNLFGSARDAVLSIVRKAAEVLVKTGDLSRNNITKIQESIRGDLLESPLTSCTTPRYAIVCKNCTDDRFARVFQLLSCRDRYLSALLDTSFIRDTLRHSHLCWIQKGKSEEDSIKAATCRARDLHATFLASLLTPDYVVALCNVLASKDGKVVLNSSDELAPVSDNGTLDEITEAREERDSIETFITPCSLDMSSPSCRPTITVPESRRRSPDGIRKEIETPMAVSSEIPSPSEVLASQIKPTKTLIREEVKKEPSVPILEASKDHMEESSHPEIVTMPSPVVYVATSTLRKDLPEETTLQGESSETLEKSQASTVLNTEQERQEVTEKKEDLKIQEVPESKADVRSEGGQEQDGRENKSDLGEEAKILTQEQMNFDSLLSDFKEFEGEVGHNGHGGSSSVAQHTTSSTPQQKESVFLRLSNRIKALERNMSLSGQYLEELSRRYKKQVEEMQRSLERATSAMSEESRKGEERDSRRAEEIAALREEIRFLSKSVESLLYDRDSWQSKLLNLGQHIILIFVNVILIIFIISYCRRSVDFEDEEREIDQSTETQKPTHQRKAADLLAEKTLLLKKAKKRRPSEIASNISGTYEELMIEDQRLAVASKKEKKRKRKKEMTRRIANGVTKTEVVRYKGILNHLPAVLPSRRSSSIETPTIINESENSFDKRPDSAPENYRGWTHENRENRIEILSTREVSEVAQSSALQSAAQLKKKVTLLAGSDEVEVAESSKKGGKTGILKGKLSSPSFMKTALGSRSKRISTTSNGERKLENSESSLRPVVEGQANGGATNGYAEESDRSSSATPTSGKKEKKSTGLKKMNDQKLKRKTIRKRRRRNCRI